MITMSKTGHMYHGSTIESDDNCGTCDGAKCEWCRDMWMVNGERYFVRREAEARQEELDDEFLTLIPIKLSWNKPEEVDFYLVEDKLWVSLFVDRHIEMACNEASPAYYKHWELAVERMHKFNECLCVDKAEEIERQCSVYGCNDSSCYREMMCGKRKEKKWYM